MSFGSAALGSRPYGSAGTPHGGFPIGFTGNYQAAAAKLQIGVNYYVEISGITPRFSKAPVIGLEDKAYLARITFNPSKISLDNVQTSVGSLTVELIDPDDTLLNALAALRAANLAAHEQTMSLYLGFSDLDAFDYKKIAEYRITQVGFNGERFRISAMDRIRDMARPLLRTVKSVLASALTDVATTVPLLDASSFPTSGTAKIGREIITWTGKTSNDLTGVTRGTSGSSAASYKVGTDVAKMDSLQTHPITALLQLMISPGGSGPYDVLPYGMGINKNKIDLVQFESVRDNTALAGQTWKFDFSADEPNFLAFVEREILYFTNCRLFTNIDGKISIAQVERTSVVESVERLDRVDLTEVPESDADSRRIYNRLRIKWDWDEGVGEYKSETIINEADSQARYGVIEKATATSKGIRAGLNGAAIITSLAVSLLRRVAYPTNRVTKVRALWRKQFFDIGAKVFLTDDRAMNVIAGTRGISQAVEILEKKLDLDRALVEYVVNSSEFLGQNFAFIAPTGYILSGASGTQFTLGTGQGVKFQVGWVVSLWLRNEGTGPIATATITDVSGDVLTVSPSFGTTPTNLHKIELADYASAAAGQKAYAYISDGANPFADGRSPYLISD